MKSMKCWIQELTKTLWGKVLFGVIAIPLVIGAVIGLLTLAGLLVQWLWNQTVTEIFDTPPITLWQAVLLFGLCKILFSSNQTVNQAKEHKEVQSNTDLSAAIDE